MLTEGWGELRVSNGINDLQGLWLMFIPSEARTAGTLCTFDLAFQAWVMPGNYMQWAEGCSIENEKGLL